MKEHQKLKIIFDVVKMGNGDSVPEENGTGRQLKAI